MDDKDDVIYDIFVQMKSTVYLGFTAGIVCHYYGLFLFLYYNIIVIRRIVC